MKIRNLNKRIAALGGEIEFKMKDKISTVYLYFKDNKNKKKWFLHFDSKKSKEDALNDLALIFAVETDSHDLLKINCRGA